MYSKGKRVKHMQSDLDSFVIRCANLCSSAENDQPETIWHRTEYVS